MTLPVQDRWWLTSRGIDVLVKEGYWEIPWSTTQSGIKLLLQRLPMVEQVYRILPTLRVADEIGNLKPILDFNWFHGSRIHAVAHYDHDVLVMFTWVGLSSKSPVLRDKWADHLVDLQTYHLGSGWDHWMPGYDALADVQPSAWVVVGHDHWSAHIADDVWYPNADVGDKHVYSCGSSLVSTPPSRPSPSWIAETFRQVEVGRPEVLANPTRGHARLKALQGKFDRRQLVLPPATTIFAGRDGVIIRYGGAVDYRPTNQAIEAETYGRQDTGNGSGQGWDERAFSAQVAEWPIAVAGETGASVAHSARSLRRGVGG